MAARFTRTSLRSYTRFVHLSKFTLSLLIIMTLVFVVAAPMIDSQDEGIRVAFATIEEKKDTPPLMKNPRFQGVDASDQPYFVRAHTALQTADDVITMDMVTADFTTEDDVWLALAAKKGTLKLGEEALQLQGDVQLYDDAGQEMVTSQLRIDLDKLQAFGDSPVQIQGSFGHIRANSFALLDKGNRMVFNEDVYVLLTP